MERVPAAGRVPHTRGLAGTALEQLAARVESVPRASAEARRGGRHTPCHDGGGTARVELSSAGVRPILVDTDRIGPQVGPGHGSRAGTVAHQRARIAVARRTSTGVTAAADRLRNSSMGTTLHAAR